jgi:hypothetical protein
MFQFSVVGVEFSENLPVFVTCMSVSISGRESPPGTCTFYIKF